jgi:hypothetical protein
VVSLLIASFSVEFTREALSTSGGAKSKFLPVIPLQVTGEAFDRAWVAGKNGLGENALAVFNSNSWRTLISPSSPAQRASVSPHY